MKSSFVALLAIALTALIALPGVVGTPTARGAAEVVGRGAIDDAIRFRESVGLESGRAFVRSTFRSDAYSSDDFGVPLSAAEVDIIHERQRRTALAAPGHAWAQARPDFAGAWTDQLRDGLIVYQFTGDVADETLELDRLLPAEVLHEVRSVERTLADLRAIKEAISADIETLLADGIDLTGVGLDISGNVVSVAVSDEVDRARAVLAERFGDAVVVERGEAAVADPGRGPLTVGVKLPNLPLSIGAEGGVGWSVLNGQGVGGRDAGTWSVSGARTEPDGHLRFHVSVTPADPGTPIEPGPAVLAVGLTLVGGLGGDIGFGRTVRSRLFDAGSCSGSPCTYGADVTLDATAIPEAIASLPQVEPTGVSVGISLVRTYGQGEWLQIVQLSKPEELSVIDQGTLREPTDTEGDIISGAIFRASDARVYQQGQAVDPLSLIEASRRRQGDRSDVTPTVRVAVETHLIGCALWWPVSILDEWGAIGYQSLTGTMDPAGELARVPDGATWSLVLGPSWNAATAGSFATEGSDLRLRATFDCSDRDRPAAPAFEVDEVDRLPEPSTVREWSVVRDSSVRGASARRPFAVASLGDRLVSMASTPAGWRVRRSGDGWHWRTRPLTTRGRHLPRHGTADHARVIPTDVGLVLAMVTHDRRGVARLATWSSRDGQRWVASPGRDSPRLPRPVSDLQLASAPEVMLALAASPGRAILLSSRDGRTWREQHSPSSLDILAIGSGVGRIVAVTEASGQATVATSMDGEAWQPLWDVPQGAAAPFRIAEGTRGVVLVAGLAGAGPGNAVWLRASGDAAWQQVMRTWPDSGIDEVSVRGDDVVLGGRIVARRESPSRYPWFAASHDGGRTWRQSATDDGAGHCRIRVAAGEQALTGGTADCGGPPTVWRTDSGTSVAQAEASR